jgi:hypothetical protein
MRTFSGKERSTKLEGETFSNLGLLHNTGQKKPVVTLTSLLHLRWHLHLHGVVKLGDPETLYSLLAAGLSPNACNQYGDSLVHIVCRRGDYKSLNVLLQFGGDIDMVDDNGRTPLHDACWCPNVPDCLATVMLLIKRCNKNTAHLFYQADNRGALPLSYVCQEQCTQWFRFLAIKKDDLWPDLTMTTMEAAVLGKPPVCGGIKKLPLKQNHPSAALPVDLARMVAAGKLDPEEANYYSMTSRNNQEEAKPAQRYLAKDGKPTPGINVEYTIHHTQEEEKQHHPTRTIADKYSDIDSTAYPDSVSGVELFCDSNVDAPADSGNQECKHEEPPQATERDVYKFSEIDSTAFVDSVSGVAFHCDSYVDRHACGANQDEEHPQEPVRSCYKFSDLIVRHTQTLCREWIFITSPTLIVQTRNTQMTMILGKRQSIHKSQ